MDGLWATKSEGFGLIVVQFVSKISKLCCPDPPTSQTDERAEGRTDGRHAIAIPRYALQSIAR